MVRAAHRPLKFLEEGSEADFTGALNKSKIES
jgi:hypothetical protein